MQSYLSQELYQKGWKGGLHISDKSGVTVVDFVQVYNNDNTPIAFDTASIPSKEAIESEIVDFEKSFNAKGNRRIEYLPIEEQLDMQYWDSVNDTTKWKDHIGIHSNFKSSILSISKAVDKKRIFFFRSDFWCCNRRRASIATEEFLLLRQQIYLLLQQ